MGLSNAVGLVVDSPLLLLLAFGSLTYLAGQLVGKTATTVIAVALRVGTRTRRRATVVSA